MNTKPILECVPNFSEGRDQTKIRAIADEIGNVPGVKLLHVDPGYDANRTVITFAGGSDAVVEAAFRAVKKASEIIDMRVHQGAHPRFGATDVLPLVPVSGITMEEAVILARKLGERIGNELGVHVYCYEFAAFDEKRRNLANCRAGEYEGLPAKLSSPEWKPDFGPVAFNARSGAVAVGVRDFLIAYNINLSTGDVNIAKSIAAELRGSGKRVTMVDSAGHKTEMQIPGVFKEVKAIGWYLPNYNKVQVSTNITNMNEVPVHTLFEKAKEIAVKYHTQVTGSELVGLIPLQVLLGAGEYYQRKLGRAAGSKEQLIALAIGQLGLAELSPFLYQERVLEFTLGENHG